MSKVCAIIVAGGEISPSPLPLPQGERSYVKIWIPACAGMTY